MFHPTNQLYSNDTIALNNRFRVKIQKFYKPVHRLSCHEGTGSIGLASFAFPHRRVVHAPYTVPMFEEDVRAIILIFDYCT